MVGIYQGVGFVTGRGQGCIFPGDWKGWLGLVVLDLAAVQDEWFWKQVYSRVGG